MTQHQISQSAGSIFQDFRDSASIREHVQLDMTAPRLPFLWPMLFRPIKAPRQRPRISVRRTQARRVTTTPRPSRESVAQRYGTAQEPAPHLRDKEAQKGDEEQQKKLPEPIEEEEEEEPPPKPSTTPSQSKVADAAEAGPPSPAPDPPKTAESKPLDTILHMPSPQEEEKHKPPHLKTPPYVHHFDTYSLVKDLTKSGFSEEQSVTVMKSVRHVLTDNMDLAREGLVSKSNVENETYLFRAACSELRTEIGNSRKGEIETMRTQRNQLQHEVDILGQKMGQETTHLKDELKGLFDDRKMAVRQEQRTMETKVYLCILTWAMMANTVTDPGTQLQDHHLTYLGCSQRDRSLTMDPHSQSRHDNRSCCIHALHRATILKSCQPSAEGREEERSERASFRRGNSATVYRQACERDGRSARRRAAHYRRWSVTSITREHSVITALNTSHFLIFNPTATAYASSRR